MGVGCRLQEIRPIHGAQVGLERRVQMGLHSLVAGLLIPGDDSLHNAGMFGKGELRPAAIVDGDVQPEPGVPAGAALGLQNAAYQIGTLAGYVVVMIAFMFIGQSKNEDRWIG